MTSPPFVPLSVKRRGGVSKIRRTEGEVISIQNAKFKYTYLLLIFDF